MSENKFISDSDAMELEAGEPGSRFVVRILECLVRRLVSQKTRLSEGRYSLVRNLVRNKAQL